MSAYFSDRFITLVWAVLVLLTLMTYGIGEAGMAGRWVMLTLLVIAFVKGQVVAGYFMGLRHAGSLWRGIVRAYFLIVGGLIAIAYLIAPRT